MIKQGGRPTIYSFSFYSTDAVNLKGTCSAAMEELCRPGDRKEEGQEDDWSRRYGLLYWAEGVKKLVGQWVTAFTKPANLVIKKKVPYIFLRNLASNLCPFWNQLDYNLSLALN